MHEFDLCRMERLSLAQGFGKELHIFHQNSVWPREALQF